MPRVGLARPDCGPVLVLHRRRSHPRPVLVQPHPRVVLPEVPHLALHALPGGQEDLLAVPAARDAARARPVTRERAFLVLGHADLTPRDGADELHAAAGAARRTAATG